MIKIKVNGMLFTFQDGEWTGEEPHFVKAFNNIAQMYVASPSNPSKAWVIGHMVLAEFAGDIVEFIPEPREHVPGRIY